MACVFRKAIAQRIVSSLKHDIVCEEENAIRKLALLVKMPRQETADGKFFLDWNEGSKILYGESRDLDSQVMSSIRGPKDLILADGLEKVLLLKNNVVGFTVNENYFTQEVLRNLHDIGEGWNERNCLIGSLVKENVIIEYSSPNIAKTFHVGHLRSTIIGNSLANVHAFLNHKVTRINYLGDWGTQYGLLSLGYDKYGSDEELQKNPLQHLLTVYIAANSEANSHPNFADQAKENFVQLERGDERLLQRWKKFRDLSLDAYQKTYNRLGVRFDVMSSESEYHHSAAKIIERLLEEKLVQQTSDGAVMIRIPYTSVAEKDILLAKRDGSSIYLSRDVAAAIDRKNKFNFDKMCYVVDSRQLDHFVSLKNVLEKMGHEWHNTLHHIKYGLIQGMSSRMGQAIFLDELLDDAKSRARTNMELSPNLKVEADREEVADILGISGLIYYDLSRNRLKPYNFSWKDALATKQDSGIALQYSHARLCSLERENEGRINPDSETNVLHEDEVTSLIYHLARFDDVICKTAEKYEPSLLVRYLTRLSHLIGAAYKVLPVKGQDRVTAKARLLLFHSAKEVLRVGMKLIGLKPLDKM